MASTRNAKWDNQQPLEICPEEDVWMAIGLYLTNPYDLVNFSKSSSEIEAIILQVFPSLYFVEIFKHVAPHLEFKDIRLCREVSRLWNELMVIHLNNFHDSVQTFPLALLSHRRSEQDGVDIGRFDKVGYWKKEIDNRAPINPVAFRSFCLKPVDRQITEFNSRCTKHLSTWGHHTKNLKFDYGIIEERYMHLMADRFTTIDYLGFIQDCLRHVPNLKTLNLNAMLTGTDIEPQRLQDWLETHPFPPLPFLRHFNCAPLKPIVFIWGGLVTAYQSTLESLSVESDKCFSFLEDQNINLPLLTKLTLGLKSSEVSKLRRVAKRSDWRLKHLEVYIDKPSMKLMEHKVDFQKLLRYSESTLELLHFDILQRSPDAYPPGEEFFVGVTLPGLKMFEVFNFDLQSLDFLFQFSPNLTRLKVEDVSSGRSLPPPLSKILNVYDEDNWKNVWNHLGSLQIIDMKWDYDWERNQPRMSYYSRRGES